MALITKWSLTLLVGILCPTFGFAEPAITVTPDKSDAVYQVGEKVTWNVKVTGDTDAPIKSATYVLKKGGAATFDQGTITFTNDAAMIQGTLNEPGTILAQVTASVPGQKDLVAFGGAAVAPEQLKPSAPRPDDFDAFWKAKLAQLAAIPPNPVLVKEDSGKPGLDYWKITLDNINGMHVQGQLARPAGDQKLPAMLIVQWAGVYPLQKEWVTNRAAEGWLVLDVMAHDLPIDQPKEFYDDQSKNALKGYTAIGNDDREKSYFLHMFLGDYRAAEYLASRSDWDGKTLIVSGTSQGGMQSFATAALDPKITAMLVMVPAGCDNTGKLAGRQPGWPFWSEAQQAMDTSRYFDPVNFASLIKCPALVGPGLIDVIAPPSGIFAAFNQLQGPKELVILPESNHQGTGNTQAPYHARETAWFTALRTTGAPPPKP
jgi:cephalosporin-C deacetylase-like acetyl esterase